MKKNYYDILGISKNSTQQEIINAYKKLFAKYCYNKNINNQEIIKNFQEINEANEVLSDPIKRKKYDEFIKFKLDINFNSFNDQNQPKKGQSYIYNLKIKFSETFSDISREIKLSTGQKKLINIPLGIVSGSKIKLSNFGGPGINGGPNGDLIIRIIVLNDTKFILRGKNLYYRKSIKFTDLFSDQKIRINLPNEVIDFNLKALTNPQKLIRIKNKGYYSIDGERGDLYIKLKLQEPKKILSNVKDKLNKILSEIEY